MKKTKLQEALREQIKGNYFCDEVDNDGNFQTWEPFENWDLENIEEQIEIDVDVMTYFIDNNKELIIDYLKGLN